jgi:hypothetical protein
VLDVKLSGNLFFCIDQFDNAHPLAYMPIMALQGAHELRRVLVTRSQDDVASAIGATQQAVSRWALGLRVPTAYFQMRMEAALGIPQSAWLTAEQRAILTALVRGKKDKK